MEKQILHGLEGKADNPTTVLKVAPTIGRISLDISNPNSTAFMNANNSSHGTASIEGLILDKQGIHIEGVEIGEVSTESPQETSPFEVCLAIAEASHYISVKKGPKLQKA